jgi:hypothetical protein
MSVGYELEDLCSEMKKAISGLFHVNGSDIIDRENGSYFSIFARATKRMRAILSIDREILIIGNTYLDQQARTISVAKQLISEFGNRLEPRIFIIVHRDPRGNSKLKKWGREDGVTVIPIYAASNKVPRGQELEKLLSFEFFSQDPFDVTGPVDSDAQFFGRRTEAQELARKLQQGQIRACFGIRKIGKTSIMHRVIREIEANYPCLVVFIDCQKDSVFQATAADVIMSIAITIERDNSSGGEFREVSVNHHGTSMVKSSAALESAISKVNVPLILAFDEWLIPLPTVNQHVVSGVGLPGATERVWSG